MYRTVKVKGTAYTMKLTVISQVSTTCFNSKAVPTNYTNYGTDLMQCCTRMRVIGHYSSSAQSQLSMSFNGLELELERKP